MGAGGRDHIAAIDKLDKNIFFAKISFSCSMSCTLKHFFFVILSLFADKLACLSRALLQILD
jgi:hypothetical protein